MTANVVFALIALAVIAVGVYSLFGMKNETTTLGKGTAGGPKTDPAPKSEV